MTAPTSLHLPSFEALMNPMLRALEALGGSTSIDETVDKVAELVGLTDEQLQVPHGNEKSRSEVGYRLAWTRTYLKAYGLLENSSRGIWSLTATGKAAGEVDSREIARTVVAMGKRGREQAGDDVPIDDGPDETVETTWRELAIQAILRMHPAAFERLAQRVLRESGFIQVEVTGRSGDGGIDGKGIFRIGLLSFHVNFQCKRWQGVVGPATIREFRGATTGRADKGLVITTSSFTKDAVREATRDGALAIDLVDGQQLLDMLRDLQLGVTTKRVEIEDITVDSAWFENV